MKEAFKAETRKKATCGKDRETIIVLLQSAQSSFILVKVVKEI